MHPSDNTDSWGSWDTGTQEGDSCMADREPDEAEGAALDS